MSNEIKSKLGQSVGFWDGKNVKDLQSELDRIRGELTRNAPNDRLFPAGVPHREQLPKDLESFSAYPIWACDSQENCLCGARANRVVSAEDVRRFSMIDHH